MVHMTPDDLPELPVEKLAEFLLGCARDDPTLLARSNVDSGIRCDAQARVPAERVPLGLPAERVPLGRPVAAEPLRLPPARNDPELEELVSIAVACARRAEDALHHAREVSWMARRRMSVIAAVTATGVVVTAAAIVLEPHRGTAGARLTEVVSAVNDVTDMQRQTVAQLAEVRSDVAALRDGTASSQPAAAPVTQAIAPTTGRAGIPADRAPAATAHGAAVSEPVQPAPPDTTTSSAMAGQVRTPEPLAVAANVEPYLPPRASHEARHYYRPPVRGAIYYRRGPPYILAQVVANVRRNLYGIFH